MVHAELAENWSLKALARHLKAHAITEMRHAERHMERILFLEGFPEVSRIGEIRIGKNVEELKLAISSPMLHQQTNSNTDLKHLSVRACPSSSLHLTESIVTTM